MVSWGRPVLTRNNPTEGNSVESVVVSPFLTQVYHTRLLFYSQFYGLFLSFSFLFIFFPKKIDGGGRSKEESSWKVVPHVHCCLCGDPRVRFGL